MERLDFRLPDFLRVSWVSDRAKEVWGPRLDRITRAWREIEWLSVAAGFRHCGVLTVPPEEYVPLAGSWVRSGLFTLPIESICLPSQPGAPAKPLMIRVVVGSPRAITDFQGAFDAADGQEIGRLIGTPRCCAEFYRAVWVEQGLEDTTWPMAVKTAPVPEGVRRIEVSGPPEANILWHWMGVRAVPHMPCRFDCENTVELGKKFAEVGQQAGYEDEMNWMLEVLSWPVEFSALHGIAEIKTPILKVCTRTDATPGKYVVRREGDRYPAEGVHGLNFPYRIPNQPLHTLSRKFLRGLDNPITIVAPLQSEQGKTM